MASRSAGKDERDVPWPQRLLERPWLLAALALLFYTLSYVVWGLVDIFTVPAG